MKAFIFVALVACAAARTLDLETLRQVRQEKTLLNRPVVPEQVTEDLLKEQEFKKIGQQNLIESTLPVERTVGGIYNYDNVVDVDRVLTFQELYNTPLFQEYITLPLFRQYIQYPSFQRFVGSVYFQRFYQLPAYKQYFVNPVLFYKYIYPIVQLFNTEYTLPTVYGQEQDVLGLQTLVDDVLLKNRNYLPYAYTYNRFAVPTKTFTGPTNYKFLLEKLYKSLYANQPIVDTQVKTDVKLIPEKVAVEPITNRVVVEEPRIVDVKVEQQIPVVDTVVPVTTDKVFDTVVLTETDVRLLRELVRQQIITPETFETIIAGKINYVTFLRQVLLRREEIPVELFNQIIARIQVVDTVVPATTVLNQRAIVILRDLFQKNIINEEVYQAVLTGRVEFPTVLRTLLVRRGITIELVNQIINRIVAETIVPVTTEQDIVFLRELVRQNVIPQEVFQAVLVGKYDVYDVLRQFVVRDFETVVPTVALTERRIVFLKDLVRQNIISQDVYQSVVYGKIEFVTVLRQILERRGLTTELINLFINRLVSEVPVTTEQDTVLLKELVRRNLITYETYQSFLYGRFDIFAVLRQVVFRGVDTVYPYAGVDRTERYNYNNIFGYKNFGYNTEYPTIRNNIYNRYPIVA